jgi:MSHA biogenesis protein MshI
LEYTVGLFSSAHKESLIGVDFQHDGVAVAQVRAGPDNTTSILRAEFVRASSQEAQVEALRQWVRSNRLQKATCVCLVAQDDYNVYQVEKPEVEDAELIQAVTWKIKDLIGYDVVSAVVDSYPMPVSSKNNRQQVGVVAAHEAVIGNYVDSIKSSAMVLSALDIHDLVRSNLQIVRQSAGQSLALLSFNGDTGLISVYHDTDLYVSREFNIGIDQLELTSDEDESAFDALLLEIQRSLDYFESFYGIGNVSDLRIFPRQKATEKMVSYLQNISNYDFDFISLSAPGNDSELDPHCFHAYCAALRGVGA